MTILLSQDITSLAFLIIFYICRSSEKIASSEPIGKNSFCCQSSVANIVELSGICSLKGSRIKPNLIKMMSATEERLHKSLKSNHFMILVPMATAFQMPMVIVAFSFLCQSMLDLLMKILVKFPVYFKTWLDPIVFLPNKYPLFVCCSILHRFPFVYYDELNTFSIQQIFKQLAQNQRQS